MKKQRIIRTGILAIVVLALVLFGGLHVCFLEHIILFQE